MIALSKTRRRILLYGLAALFFVAAPFLIFYSVGLFVDFRTRTLTPTGGIFVKTNATGAKIFLNGALAKENSFLAHGALLNDITQGNYLLRVEKESYQPWQKKISVKNGEVSEYRHIILISQEPAETTIFQIASPNTAIQSIMPSANGTRAVVTISENGKTQLFLMNMANGQMITTGINHILEMEPSPSGNKLLIKRTGGKNMPVWSVADITENLRIVSALPNRISYHTEDKIKTFPADAIKKILFHPTAETKLYLQDKEDNLFLYDPATNGPATPPASIVASKVNSFYPTTKGIFFLDKNGFLALSDFEGKQITVLDNKGLFLTEAPSKFIFSSEHNELGIIDRAGGIFFLADGGAELRAIGKNAENGAFSPEGDKIAHWNSGRVTVAWLADNKESPFEKSGDAKTIFEAGGSEKIRDVVWLDDNLHLLLLTDKRIVLSEIDSRGGVAATTVINANANNFFYNQDNKKIYWANKNVIRSISLE